MPLAVQDRILQLIREGAGPNQACHELGIPTSHLRKLIQTSPDFQERLADAREYAIEAVEQSLYSQAVAGSFKATQFYLKNLRPQTYNREELSKIELQAKLIHGPSNQNKLEVAKIKGAPTSPTHNHLHNGPALQVNVANLARDATNDPNSNPLKHISALTPKGPLCNTPTHTPTRTLEDYTPTSTTLEDTDTDDVPSPNK